MATKSKPKTIPGPVPAMSMTRAAKPERSRAALRGELHAAIQDLGEYDLKHLATCVTILKTCCGCTTPAEEFIRGLLGSYSHLEGALSPAFIKSDLEEFVADHECAIEAARLMAQRFPKEVLVTSDNTNDAAREAQ